jgi:hypothetical protein
LLNRIKRGAIYKPEMVEKALTGFFKGSNLGALRELTLRQAAHEVDLKQSAYDETRAFQVPRISEALTGGAMDNQPKERILIHITADPSTAMLIRRGRRVADYLHADCTALFVHQTPELSQLPAEERQAIENTFASRGVYRSKRGSLAAAISPRRWWNSLAASSHANLRTTHKSVFWNGCLAGTSPRTSFAWHKTFRSQSSPTAVVGKFLSALY